MESVQKLLILLIVYIVVILCIMFPMNIGSISSKLFDSSRINVRKNVSVNLYIKKENKTTNVCGTSNIATLDTTINACVLTTSSPINPSDLPDILDKCNHPEQYYNENIEGCCPMDTIYNNDIKSCIPCQEGDYYSMKDKKCKSKDCSDVLTYNDIARDCVQKCGINKYYNTSTNTCDNINDSHCNGPIYNILNTEDGGCVKIDDYIGFKGLKYKITWMGSDGSPNPPNLQNIKLDGSSNELVSRIIKIDDVNGLVILENGSSFKNPELTDISEPQNLLENIIGSSCGSIANLQNKFRDMITKWIEQGYAISERYGEFLKGLFKACGYNPASIAVCTNDNISYYRTLTHMIILYIGFNLGLLWYFAKKRLEFFGPSGSEKHTIKSFLIKITGIFASVFFTVMLISGTIGLFQSSSNVMNIIIGISLLIVVISMLAVIYMIIPESGKNNTLFKLLKHTVFYIPCLYIQFIDNIKHQLNITANTSWIILTVELIIIFSVVILPILLSKSINNGGIQLLKDPIYINTERTLATEEDIQKWRNQSSELVIMDDSNCNGQPKLVNGEWQKTGCKTTKATIVPSFTEKYVYNYALSFWVYINPQPTNVSKTGDTSMSILDFESRPNVMYDIASNKFIIRTQIRPNLGSKSGKTSDIILSEPLLQKWNHIVLNYYGGTLDVFVNNELEKTVDNIIPEQDTGNSKITSGKGASVDSLGINGGLCNVVYYNKTLSKSDIYWIYKSLNTKSPPVL